MQQWVQWKWVVKELPSLLCPLGHTYQLLIPMLFMCLPVNGFYLTVPLKATGEQQSFRFLTPQCAVWIAPLSQTLWYVRNHIAYFTPWSQTPTDVLFKQNLISRQAQNKIRKYCNMFVKGTDGSD